MHGCGHIVRGRTGAQQWTLGCAGLTKVEQSGLMDQFERDQSVPGMRKARPAVVVKACNSFRFNMPSILVFVSGSVRARC